MKILFMGTPDFALFSLKALYNSEHRVCGVVTQTDKQRGRGNAVIPSPVKVFAAEHGIPVYQPKTLRGEEFSALLTEIAPDMIVVSAFGKILPENVINYPEYGCINVHGSCLPEYRGAAPMQRAIIDGKTETGITIMYMDAGVDTGDILLTEKIPILPEDSFENVHDRLGILGASALIKAIELIVAGKAVRTAQDSALATYAAKIEKSDCLVDFSRPSADIYNLIRGLSPEPLAFTHTPDGKLLKLVWATLPPAPPSTELEKSTPGCVTELDKTGSGAIYVRSGDGIIAIKEVIPEGRGKMCARDFINGRKIKLFDILK